MIVPSIDHATANVLADHISDGYSAYTQARIDTTVTTYVVYLSIIGALGVVSWFWTVRAVNAGERWARGAATAMLVLGTGIALSDLLAIDGSMLIQPSSSGTRPVQVTPHGGSLDVA